MLKLMIVAAVAGVIIAGEDDSGWSVFKAKYEKAYDEEVDHIRRFIWEENLKKIASHNDLYVKGLTSFYMGENQFSDMTSTEFRQTIIGAKSIEASRNQPRKHSLRSRSIQDLPPEVNWVTKGYVRPVKNQGACGCGWAFATTGALEGAYKKTYGKNVSFSEKNLLDCTRNYSNFGCDGGMIDNAFRYVIDNKGIDLEMYYPYKPEASACKYNPDWIGGTEDDYHDVQSGSEENLKYCIATISPIAVTIDASKESFQHYSGGVYDEPKCNSDQPSHGALAAGYGTSNGTDYYLVKNSIGTSWGLKGYIMMSRNKNNQCGIATIASYPVV